jgi:hypothetical protein
MNEELKVLTDNFLSEHGALTKSEDEKINANVLIGIPTHKGDLKFGTVISLVTLIEKFRSLGIRFTLDIKPGCPLVQIVRNYFANRSAFEVDDHGERFSHLLMIDADGSGFEEAVVRLLKLDKPVSAVMYSVKSLDWKRIAHAVRAGVSPEHLSEFGGVPDIVDKQPFNITTANPVKRIGTGTMLVRCDVLRTIAEKNLDRRYLVETSYYFGPPNPPREFQYDFFQTRIDPETKNYESEDFYFCTEVRKHGFEVWALASERTSHFGTYNFSLNMHALASLGAAKAT